jgi:hypothetical protein
MRCDFQNNSGSTVVKAPGNNGGRNMIANIGNDPDKHRPPVDNMGVTEQSTGTA